MTRTDAANSLDVLLIDDHTLFAEGLAAVLSGLPEAPKVTICARGDTAIQHLEKLKVDPSVSVHDVILLDLDLPDISGSDLIKSLRIRGVQTPIVVISGTKNEEEIQRAVDSGACGFLSKSSSSSIVMTAINAAVNGDTYMPEEYWDRIDPYIAPRISGIKTNDDSQAFSARQLEVLSLLERGYSNARIARILDISVATVKSHLVALFKKLNVNNRTECVRAARENDLLN